MNICWIKYTEKNSYCCRTPSAKYWGKLSMLSGLVVSKKASRVPSDRRGKNKVLISMKKKFLFIIEIWRSDFDVKSSKVANSSMKKGIITELTTAITPVLIHVYIVSLDKIPL